MVSRQPLENECPGFDEFIADVENRIARLIAARLLCIEVEVHIRDMERRGHIPSAEALRLLDDMDHLRQALADGRKLGGWVRNPPVEVEAMVLARQVRE